MAEYIIAYDICCEQRLQKVYRILCGYAVPIERSVFLFIGTERLKDKCLEDLMEIIEIKEDDLRCYHLPKNGFQFRLGTPALPEGIHWTPMPTGDVFWKD